MALLEIFLPATNTPPWLHVAFLILILAAYLGLAYVTFATQGFYTYAFLNPDNGAGRLAAYIVGIAAGCAVVFLIVWCLVWVRRRLTRPGKKSRKETVGIYRRPLHHDVEMVSK